MQLCSWAGSAHPLLAPQRYNIWHLTAGDVTPCATTTSNICQPLVSHLLATNPHHPTPNLGTLTEMDTNSPDYGNKLTHGELLRDQKLGLVQKWKVLFFPIPLYYHLRRKVTDASLINLPRKVALFQHLQALFVGTLLVCWTPLLFCLLHATTKNKCKWNQ